MAHLRKKEKWLDHARAMIEVVQELYGFDRCVNSWRSSDDRRSAGDSPFCARRPSPNSFRTLRGIVEADETFVSLTNPFKGRWSDLARGPRKRGGPARHPGPYQGHAIPSSRRPRTGGARPSTRSVPPL